jgi:tubulin polyglutamylase TTLL9
MRPGLRSADDWDFFWADVQWIRECFDHTHLADHQRVNHFRNHYELTKKNLMYKNIKRMRKQVEREQGKEEAQRFDFVPTTFELPAEYSMFVEEFKRVPGPWIMKPAGRSQGKGIFLFTKLSQVQEWKRDSRWAIDGLGASAANPTTASAGHALTGNTPASVAAAAAATLGSPHGGVGADQDADEPPETYIAQRYLEHPYLIGGRKFDMRIYALVTCFNPMTVWLYRAGFARFTNARYSMDYDDLSNNYIHLTNVAVQKTFHDYNPDGSKWAMHNLKMYIQTRHGREQCQRAMNNIQKLILDSLRCVQRVIINDKHCFELYGYDILFDEALKPWLIEINASPSLTASSQADFDMKFEMLDDLLTIVDMERKLPSATGGGGEERRIGGFDLILKEGTGVDGTSDCTLGCMFERPPGALKPPKKTHFAHAKERPDGT